ncbi:MAG TPA: TIGR00159 family protein [Clostridiales bacterium]|nr:TIGR00159 family protein [Clostridiales bacterium]
MLRRLSDLIYFLQPYIQFPYVIRHIIDIAIVAYVLYRFILLIQRTQAEQVLKGLATLLAITWLSGALKLNTVYWILKNTATVGVIALLIVFQPELRRALEQIGRGRIFEKTLFIQEEEDIDNIVNHIIKAVENMSKDKIGALIVIERRTGLNDVIETGVKIDGYLTQQLLENIFVPNTPLHDGAVVVRGERIAAAGCFLPLTRNPNINKQIGTRHRAAIGITEKSDAIAIIVSEETGIISMADDGKLTRYLDPKTLGDILKNIYGQENEPRNFSFKKWRAKHE